MGRQNFPNMQQMVPMQQEGMPQQTINPNNYQIQLPQFDVEAFKQLTGNMDQQKQFVGDIIYNLITPAVGEL